MIRKYMINGSISAEIVPTIGGTIVRVGAKYVEEYFWWSDGCDESYLREFAAEFGIKVKEIMRK